MPRLYTMGGNPAERHLTVAGLRAAKGTRRFVQATAVNGMEAAAAEAAGIDMLSIGYDDMADEIRAEAPKTFQTWALPMTHFASATELMRAAMDAMDRGADAVYYCGPIAWVEELAKASIPVMGHAGLVPRKSQWIGGLRAVGRSPEEARAVFRAVKDLENAGAFAVELEVIPSELTAAITKRTGLITSSIGAGPHADVIFQFTEDALGDNPNPPRHAMAFDNFLERRAEMQQARIDGLRAFRDAVHENRYPSASDSVTLGADAVEDVLEALD